MVNVLCLWEIAWSLLPPRPTSLRTYYLAPPRAAQHPSLSCITPKPTLLHPTLPRPSLFGTNSTVLLHSISAYNTQLHHVLPNQPSPILLRHIPSQPITTHPPPTIHHRLCPYTILFGSHPPLPLYPRRSARSNITPRRPLGGPVPPLLLPYHLLLLVLLPLPPHRLTLMDGIIIPQK